MDCRSLVPGFKPWSMSKTSYHHPLFLSLPYHLAQLSPTIVHKGDLKQFPYKYSSLIMLTFSSILFKKTLYVLLLQWPGYRGIHSLCINYWVFFQSLFSDLLNPLIFSLGRKDKMIKLPWCKIQQMYSFYDLMTSNSQQNIQCNTIFTLGSCCLNIR
jgi:hypothetical protein